MSGFHGQTLFYIENPPLIRVRKANLAIELLPGLFISEGIYFYHSNR